jgi:uncharacterized membrane protein YoaK (UPF0700 family)
MSSRSRTLVDAFARSPFPICMLVAIAGAVDALVMLHSKELLAVYMTGNSTKLGQSLVAGAWGKAGPLLIVVACFFVATTCAAWIGSRLPSWRASLCLALTAIMLVSAMPFAGEQYSLQATCLVAAGMGAINQSRADESGVTFITGALVRTGRQLADGDWRAAAMGLLRWLSLIIGAAIGTLLDFFFDTGALAVIACIALACALAAALHRTESHTDTVNQSSNDGGVSHARK